MPTQSQQQKVINEVWTAANLSSTVLGFFLSAVTLWHGLRSGGEFRPINKNKLKISGELAKLLGAIALTVLGIIALITSGGIIPIVTLVSASIGFATCLYQFVIDIKNGDYMPINKNKLKISGVITKAFGTAAILGLAAASLTIPGVAPTLALIGAFIGFSMLIHQLIIAVHKFKKGTVKLREFKAGQFNELEMLQNLQKTKILTPEQTTKLEELKSQYAQLKERPNWIKIMDIGTLVGMIAGGGLIAIGLGVTLIFPPAGLTIAATGAVITAASGIIKAGSFIVDLIQKNRSHAGVQPPTAEASKSPTARPPSPTTVIKKPHSSSTRFFKEPKTSNNKKIELYEIKESKNLKK